MSKYFTPALNADMQEKGVTNKTAADAVGITPRQFIRQKQSDLPPVYMVSELIKKGIVKEETGRKYLADVEEAIFRRKRGRAGLWPKIKDRFRRAALNGK